MHQPETIKLLIVEDDEDDYFLLRTRLDEISFQKEIFWVKTYEKAIEVLQSQEIDLLIIDYFLGPYTGIDLIYYVNDKFPYTPTILLTGLNESTLGGQALKSGVYDYLIKDRYTSENLDRSIRYSIERSKVLISLKESENKFKNLFENAMEYVFLVDLNLFIVDANKMALKLFNATTKEEIIGVNIAQYITPKIFENHNTDHSSVEVEVSIPEHNKKCFCILNLSKINLSKNVYQLALFDITERKLNEQKEKLLEKQALTGKVARVIAHEIKNPLTNIHLSLLELKTLVKNNNVHNKEDSPNEFLDIIERNSRRINTLIDDLLNATRFDTINLKEIQVTELVTEALVLIQDRIKLKGIKVEQKILENLTIKGDKEKLVIALLNILVNAVEAIDIREGKLEITMEARNKNANIVITDNGKGIPQEDLGKLFEPFFTSKKSGTGLGLTATYNIITKHDGSITVASELNKGTSFIISLPLNN